MPKCLCFYALYTIFVIELKINVIFHSCDELQSLFFISTYILTNLNISLKEI